MRLHPESGASLVSVNPRDDTFHVSQGRTVLATRRDGWLEAGPYHGLFFHQTRVLSVHGLLLNGRAPRPVSLSSVQQHSWLGYYLAEDEDESGTPADERAELRFDYRAERPYDVQGHRGMAVLHRGLIIVVRNASSGPRFDQGRLVFETIIAPRGRWHVCLVMIPTLDGKRFAPRHRCNDFLRRWSPAAQPTRFRPSEGDALGASAIATLERAREDLEALRLHDLDEADGWTMAAGLPMYVALFGRDTLTASWQASLLGTEMMRGTLHRLALRQGARVDDWRDEQPGRMLHEAQTGPLSVLRILPNARYYGSVTTSGFFPLVVAHLWHWTGDMRVVEPFIEPALAGLRWLDRYSDLDGDGLYEYRTRSIQGLRHQAWKDSGDAIVDEHGELVSPPIATCEEQGFVYTAKIFFADVLWHAGRRGEALRIVHEARELKRRFNDAFWLPQDGFFAMGLDAAKRPIRSEGSNPGHGLATGIIDRALVPAAAGRLMSEDLFSGWGVRTLSSRHPAYNPFSYHRGSVWPVEQATFSLGFARYGLFDHLHALSRAQFEAAALFAFHRLPEVFGGHARDASHPFPPVYPEANSPQAWSSSAMFSHLQALLGLYPYAPQRLLILDPHLPPWLPSITLEGLRVGRARVSIRFFRSRRGDSGYQVMSQEGPLRVVRQPSPWSLTATLKERATDLLWSFLTGW
jgi:hypothetical protein